MKPPPPLGGGAHDIGLMLKWLNNLGSVARWRYAEQLPTTEGARPVLVDGHVGADRLHRSLPWMDLG